MAMDSSLNEIYSFPLPLNSFLDYEANPLIHAFRPTWLPHHIEHDKPKNLPKILPKRRSNTVPSSRQKSHQKQSKQLHNEYDLRLIIVRHGERVDRVFGANWMKLAFDQDGMYHRFHENLPTRLPYRPNRLAWEEDTPLTRSGLKAAREFGRTLALKYIEPDYVYSSPAMRCVLTTIEMLKGLNLDRKLSIRIEPGLLEFGAARFGMSIFLRPIDWFNFGVNVDLSYQPIISTVPADERVDGYYLRSKSVVRQLEQRHSSPSSYSAHILIVAHATSPDTLTWDLMGKRLNTKNLYERSLKVAYLQTTIAERKRKNQRWYLKHLN